MAEEIVVELFKPVVMLEAIDQLEDFLSKNHLQNTFFGPGEDVEGDVIQLDIRKGLRRMAGFVDPESKAKLFDKRPYKTLQYEAVYSRMLGVITGKDLKARSFGQNPYAKRKTPAQVTAEKVGEELMEMMDAINRLIEWMCAKALFTGKVEVKGEGVDKEVDYERSASNTKTLAGTDLWSDAASDPIAQIRAFRNEVNKATARSPRKMYLGTKALNAFLANEKVQKFLENRRYNLGIVEFKELQPGLTSYGMVEGVEVLHYEDFYYDPVSATEKPFVPEYQALLACTYEQTKNRLRFCSIHDVNAGMVATKWWVNSWDEHNPSAKAFSLDSSPIPHLCEPDTTMLIKPLTEP